MLLLEFVLTSVQAASDKIIREIELFGENFEHFQPEEAEEPSAPSANVKDGAPDKAKKGKIVAKSTGHKYQFQIMESIGVPREEIKKFADPQYWLHYFPPIAKVRISLTSLFVFSDSHKGGPLGPRNSD